MHITKFYQKKKKKEEANITKFDQKKKHDS
jgi:hypothetical protein